MRRLSVLALILFMMALYGCSRVMVQVNTPAVTQTFLSPALSRTVSSTSTLTSTATIQEKVSYAPVPTRKLTTPTPTSLPLSRNGPWLLLSQNDIYTGPSRAIKPVLSNADGSAWELINIPGDPPVSEQFHDWWFMKEAPRGPFIAFQNYDLGLGAISTDCTNGAKPIERPDTIYLLKLPENRVVRQFRLFSQQSLEKIRKDECVLVKKNPPELSPVIGVVASSLNAVWSSDGRYLAFTAASDGAAGDLYLYDTVTDTLKRLTSRQNNPEILDWSPDGQTIIYRGVTRMNFLKYEVFESSGLFAVSISGTDRPLYKSNNVPWGLQWLSQSQFLFSDSYCKLGNVCTTILRRFDLSTGENEVIYSSPSFVEYTTDPIHHLLVFVNPPAENIGYVANSATPSPHAPDVKRLQGVYQYDAETRTLHPVLTEPVSFLAWDKKLQAFSTWESAYGPPDVLHVLHIRYTTDHGFVIERIDNPPNTSPDGNWKIVESSGKEYIQDARGNSIRELDEGATCGWSPDSSRYVKLVEKPGTSPETWMMVYQKDNNWQPVLARRITEGWYWWCAWLTP